MRSPDEVLRKLLGRAVLLPVLALAVMGALLLAEVRQLLSHAHWVSHTDQAIGRAQETLRLLVDRETGLRGYLISGDPLFLEPYSEAEGPLARAWPDLRGLIEDNPPQQARLEKIRRLAGEWDGFAADAIVQRRAGGTVSPTVSEGRGKRLMDGIRDGFDAFVKEERQLLAQRTARADFFAGAATAAAVIVALLCGLVLGLLARRQVQRVADAYRELLDLREELLNLTAHELRTPVTSLLLQLQHLERHGAAPDSLDVARRQARRLGELVEALIDASALSSGAELPLLRGEVDLREVAREASQKAAAGCEIELLVDDAPVSGVWDRQRLLTAVTALIANACKFGHGRLVTVEVHRRAGLAEVSVLDRGPGIPPEQREQIFGKFVRGVSQRSWGGLGLGLFAARRIAELHGGSLGLDPGPDGGSRFTVRLPA